MSGSKIISKLFFILVCLLPSLSLAKSIDFYVIDFTYNEGKRETLKEIQESLNEKDLVIVLDSLSREIVGYYDRSDRDFSSVGEKNHIISSTKSRYTGGG